MVGRASELGVLDEAVRAAKKGRGRLVGVTGDPGVGKSRLVREAALAAEHLGALVLRGRAVEGGASTPFRPLSEALLRGLRSRPEPTGRGSDPWAAALTGIVPGSALGLVDAGPGDPSLVVRAEAVLRVLGDLGGGDGVLLVLEDLHWADPDTLQVLEYVGDNGDGFGVATVVTARTEPRSRVLDLLDRLVARRSASQVSLERLPHDAATAMVEACAPGSPPEVVARVLAAAEGVPLLIEELLAAPGIPTSFAAAVEARLPRADADHVAVLRMAAVLGRVFDWRLLGVASGRSASVVEGALQVGVDAQLLVVDGDEFRFRHALTRDAILAQLLPPQRVALAAAALDAVVDQAAPDVAAEVALQAGDHARAGQLLAASGRAALERGAVATAVDALVRSLSLLARDDGERIGATVRLVEALALAGRVDEAEQTGAAALASLDDADGRASVHLALAQAAVGAARWTRAAEHLDGADALQRGPAPRADLLRAELAVSAGDHDETRRRAERVLAGEAAADLRCYAFELLGRSHRTHDRVAAQAAFEQALATATAAGMPLWRMRALHELGTIEMFDHAGTARLLEARAAAVELGVLSTAAVIDMHLAAAWMLSFSLDAALASAAEVRELSGRFGFERLRALALMFLGQIHALAGRRDEVEHYVALAAAAAPGDVEIEGSGWAGSRGMLALVEGDRDAAVAHLGHGEALLRTVRDSGPACYRGLYPLLLAVRRHPESRPAIDIARRLRMEVNRGNRGLLSWADAVLAGRDGDGDRASALFEAGAIDLTPFHGWNDIGRTLVTEAAHTDGWTWSGAPRDARPPWPITEREREVLVLVAEGLANKEIAARLRLSHRTVEKHVESLLRKTDTRSRTHLIAVTRAGNGALAPPSR